MNSTDAAAPAWWLLILSLPTAAASARMRIWRALKAIGCAALRDGAYLLPAHAPHGVALRRLADDCRAEGGQAWLMLVLPESAAGLDYARLFDRSADYAQARHDWHEAQRQLRTLAPAELARLQRKLQRDFEALRAIDYFPGAAAAEAAQAWAEIDQRLRAALSPDEPGPARGRIRRREIAAYQGRVWATRRRPGVDRVASAWLIRRFIDPGARFKWLARPADCPKSALGFDFDGATFTHVGERVTFETLLASFGLEGDAALLRLAALVRQLDTGGPPIAEASGFEAVLSGAQARLPDDDALAAEMAGVLDSLYVHFQRPAPPPIRVTP